MNISAETHVHELIDAYPYMMDWLVGRADEFKKLKNPILYNTVGRAARLKEAAAMGDIPLEQFLDEVRREIAVHEIAAEESAVASEHSQADPAVREQRQEQLKGIIRKLHEGVSVEQVKAEFDALTADIDSAEIARMEQSLIAEGMPVSEVQRLCDVHVSVFKEALEEKPSAAVAAGHPIDAYRRENAVITELTGELRDALPSLETGGEAAAAAIGEKLERLAQIETHYLRKENQLFPVLERHDVQGPTKVMWGLDDDIRGRIKTARALAAGGDAHGLAVTLPELLTMVDDMVYKEEKILLPTAQQVVSDEEWRDIAGGDAEIGYAWIEGPEGAAAKAAAAAGAPSVADAAAASGEMLLPLPTGALSLPQLDALFRAIPFDLTFVDEHDRVRFYSEGERVFPRSPGAIGREVRNCHPPQSVHKVEAILAAFKAGEKDVAEFWIETGGKFVWIRYFAMRGADGAYKGCLEVVQDATHVRSLEGQRRLLDW